MREWLNAQAAGGYVDLRRRRSERYTLPPEQAFALADEDSPAFMPGRVPGRHARAVPRRAEDRRGLPHRRAASAGTSTTTTCSRAPSASSGPATTANLVDVVAAGARRRRRASCERGARVADVGCGHGASTILMAQAFPSSTFVGFDYHDGLDRRRAPSARGRGRRRRPRALRGRRRGRLPGRRLRPGRVLRLPARHGRPGRRRARTSARRSRPDGTWLIVEPFAERPRRGQPQPGRAASSTRPRRCSARRRRCRRRSASALGAQAGEARLRRCSRGRLQPRPPRRRDAVQHGARSSTRWVLREGPVRAIAGHRQGACCARSRAPLLRTTRSGGQKSRPPPLSPAKPVARCARGVKRSASLRAVPAHRKHGRSGGTSLSARAPPMPAARPAASTWSAILRLASSIISPLNMTAPRPSSSVATR